MKLNRAKCKALHVDHGKLNLKCLLDGQWIESCFKEKILGMLVDVKLG